MFPPEGVQYDFEVGLRPFSINMEPTKGISITITPNLVWDIY